MKSLHLISDLNLNIVGGERLRVIALDFTDFLRSLSGNERLDVKTDKGKSHAILLIIGRRFCLYLKVSTALKILGKSRHLKMMKHAQIVWEKSRECLIII